MAFDYKKEYREFYMPPSKPGIITVPSMNYIAVRDRETRMQRRENTNSRSGFCMESRLPSK